MSSRLQLANAIRALSMDSVQRANSGHPGMPMGMADIAEVLWNDFLNHNPNNPQWVNRDRFVLSNGHGSMLLYALLHLTGYDLSLDDLKHFRQLHSKTPGHPEYGETPGVETTTGPLGQGLANAVGMALAEKILAQRFNKPEHEIINHFTYGFVGDGCLMEGISHEAGSLAGTWGLGKLIVVYDDNGISIDGKVGDWFSDDTVERFKAYGWHVEANVDGHAPEAIRQALINAQQNQTQPSLICCKTIIGYGSPKVAGSEKSHGAPLGEDEIEATKKVLNWPYAAFEIPETIRQAWDQRQKGQQLEADWSERFEAYRKDYPQMADEFERCFEGRLPESLDALFASYIRQTQEGQAKVATRKASMQCLDAFASAMPELIGGSADLSGSNNTWHSSSKILNKENMDGNYIHYGVREFGMSAIMNGMALHGGLIPYGGTFLVFSDYARNAVRLSALMKKRVIYVYSHDSIGLGEDGPTHQPIEHISALRLMPGMSVWRPCDAVETAVAWQQAIGRHDGPTSLLLSRQSLPCAIRNEEQLKQIACGGYILKAEPRGLDLIIMATGSEVAIALDAWQLLDEQGISARVVSIPSLDTFEKQDRAYKQAVLPDDARKRIAIEAGSPDCWYRYVGLDGVVLGIDKFGLSAPAEQVYQALGLTKEHITDVAHSLLNQ